MQLEYERQDELGEAVGVGHVGVEGAEVAVVHTHHVDALAHIFQFRLRMHFEQSPQL